MRPLEASDAAVCAGIHRQCFAHPWPVTEFESLALSASSIAHAAVDDRSHAVLGFIISRRVLDEAEVLTIAVDRERRRNGVGSALLEFHLSTLGLQRVSRLFLEVDEGNAPARALYARFGFVENGRREGYYRTADGDRAAALTMRKDVF
ncbi:MAG: ribosomal protein S18-alanine N-acetyltransferase [Beijerinckiaceae bacterium]